MEEGDQLMRRPTPIVGIAVAFLLIMMVVSVGSPLAYATGPPTLDGNTRDTCFGTSLTSPVSCTISTNNSGDLLVVEEVVIGASPSLGTVSCSGPSCPTTFTSRATATSSGATTITTIGDFDAQASSSGLLNGVTVSATFSGTSTGAMIIAFAVTNFDTTTPFAIASDVTGAANSGTASTPVTSVQVTTPNTEIMVVGMEGDQGSSVESAGSGFTIISSGASSLTLIGTAAAESQAVTGSCKSGCTVSFGASTSDWAVIGTAINSPSSIPEFPFGALPLLAIVPIVYVLLRGRRPQSKAVPLLLISP